MEAFIIAGLIVVAVVLLAQWVLNKAPKPEVESTPEVWVGTVEVATEPEAPVVKKTRTRKPKVVADAPSDVEPAAVVEAPVKKTRTRKPKVVAE